MKSIPKQLKNKNAESVKAIFVFCLKFVLFLPFAFHVNLQAHEVKFAHINTSNGLINDNVLCIAQDNFNFIWLGTEDGLCVYDGLSFKYYRNDPDNKNSISGNLIKDIVKDKNGIIWIATQNGLDKYNYYQDCFEKINYTSLNGAQAENAIILSLLNDSKNRMWLATTKGLYCIDSKGITIKCFNTRNSALASDYIFEIIEDREGRFWLATKSGLSLYSELNNSFTNYRFSESDPEGLQSNHITCVLPDSRGRLWVGSENNSISIFNIKNGLLKKIPGKNKYDAIRGMRINVIKEAADGSIWVGSVGGLHHFDESANMVEAYFYVPGKEESLSFDFVKDILFDSENRLWVGTLNGGLNTYDRRQERFEKYVSENNSSRPLAINEVSNFAEDEKGNIWIATDGYGLHYLNRATGNIDIEHKPSDFWFLKSNNIVALLHENESSLLIGTWFGGLFKYNPKSKKYISLKVPSNNTLMLYMDKSANLWASFNSYGLYTYNKLKNEYSQLTDFKNNTINDNVYCMLEDKIGNLWIGTFSSGIIMYDKKNKKFISHYLSDERSLAAGKSVPVIYSLLEDSDWNIWATTNNGLYKMKHKNGVFAKLGNTEGAPANDVFSILEDSLGMLWFTTKNGLWRYDPQKNVYKNWDESNELQNNEFRKFAYNKLSNGELIFGGKNGFNIIDPYILKPKNIFPHIYFTKLLINGKMASIGKGNTLPNNIFFLNELNLKHDQNILELEFTTVNFSNANKIHFKYRLKGLNEDWIDLKNKRAISFAGLTPDRYVLELISSNEDGVWNNKPKTLIIFISPPWYDTWIFRLLFSLSIFISVIILFRIRIKILKEQKSALERKVLRRTEEIRAKNLELEKQASVLREVNQILEEKQQYIEAQDDELRALANDLIENNKKLILMNETKNKLFSIIGHDLKNPFSTMISFSNLLATKYNSLTEKKRFEYVMLIHSLTKNIYSLLDNLLIWAKSQTNQVSFDPKEFDINLVIDKNIKLYNEMALSKSIKLLKENTESVYVFADFNMIDAIFRNILNNAIKYTNEGGIISVGYKINGTELVVVIKDTGIGISKENIDNIFTLGNNLKFPGTSGESGTGLGLLLSKEFIRHNNGKIWIESIEGNGSAFYFSLPVTKDVQ